MITSILRAVPLAAALVLLAGPVRAETTLLNVSYDVTREFYKELNPAFAAYWQKKTGEVVVLNQSHGGSSKQARAVVDGLEADVVTFNQATDIEILVKSGLVPADWRKKFPNDAAPYTSTTVFLVRPGNPKGIKDWDDLARPGVQVIIANPKTSGNGRYSYLGAWASVLAKGGSEADAIAFEKKLFANVPVLDAGGRGATTTFIQRDIGDVLVTFENEVSQIRNEFGGKDFAVVYPSVAVLAEPPVAVIEPVTKKRGTGNLAKAYLDFLWSPEAQEIVAKNHLRPRLESVAKKYKDQFPAQKQVRVDDAPYNGWSAVQKKHFDDGGLFDQIYVPAAPARP